MIKCSQQDWQLFKTGQKVWLEAKNLNLPYLTKKIAPKRLGPFEITEEVGTRSYRLKLPDQWTIHDVFHVSLLTPFKETDVHGPAFINPPPNEIEGEEEYEIEKILKHRKRGKGYHYLVHFKGYAHSEDMYLPEKNLRHASELLNEYKQKHGLLKKKGRLGRLARTA